MGTIMSDQTQKSSQEIVLEILCKYVDEKVDHSQVLPEASFEALGIDSMDVVEIIFDLEETFDIEIPDPGEIEGMDENFSTVQDLLNIVNTLID
jgi:acyl carrier protein